MLHIPFLDDSIYLRPQQYELQVKAILDDSCFLVHIECKHEKRKVERQAVQAACKNGIAIEYATVHGIALVQMAKRQLTWRTKRFVTITRPLAWPDYPEYVGW